MDSNLTFSNVWRTDGKRQRRSGSVLTDKAGSVRNNEDQWMATTTASWTALILKNWWTKN